MLVWGGVRAIYALPLLIIGLHCSFCFFFTCADFIILLKDINKFDLIDYLIEIRSLLLSALIRIASYPLPLLRTPANVTKYSLPSEQWLMDIQWLSDVREWLLLALAGHSAGCRLSAAAILSIYCLLLFYYKIVHVVQNNEKNTRDN